MTVEYKLQVFVVSVTLFQINQSTHFDNVINTIVKMDSWFVMAARKTKK